MMTAAEIEELQATIVRLRASELAWQLIAKQNERWNNLTQSDREMALENALDAVTSENIKLKDENERLRKILSERE
jgi:hypothetical protein